MKQIDVRFKTNQQCNCPLQHGRQGKRTLKTPTTFYWGLYEGGAVTRHVVTWQDAAEWLSAVLPAPWPYYTTSSSSSSLEDLYANQSRCFTFPLLLFFSPRQFVSLVAFPVTRPLPSIRTTFAFLGLKGDRVICSRWRNKEEGVDHSTNQPVHTNWAPRQC